MRQNIPLFQIINIGMKAKKDGLEKHFDFEEIPSFYKLFLHEYIYNIVSALKIS